MEFNNNFPEWKNEGVAPPETLQTSGFKGGDKPPAAWLNWLTSLVGKCIKELQEKLRLHKHTLGDVSETADRKMSYLVSAISEDGISYTATVNGVSELYDGLEITVIPNTASAQPAITLNVNGLGAKNVRAKINGYNSANSGAIAAFDKWFGEGAPITLRYVAKFDNWQTVDFSRPSASGLYGTIKEEQGGTGKTSLSEVTVGRAWHLSPNDCSNKDFNTLKTAGYYFGYTGMTNAKITSEISVLEVIPYSNDWVLQRQTRLIDGRMFIRYLKNGDTWSEWGEVFSEKNTGDLAKITHGTYAGTGKAGTSNPNTLTFDFTPKLVMISSATIVPSVSTAAQCSTTMIRGNTYAHAFHSDKTAKTYPQITPLSVSWDGDSVSWYDAAMNGATANSGNQLNASSTTYTYVAIG